MAEEGERVSVSTHVPAYQRDRWREHAERLEMSQSEFVRTMVQAGRRGFELDGGSTTETTSPVEADDRGATPGVDGLKEAVLDRLRADGPLDWDELVDRLTGDLEDRLDGALDELQASDRIRYRGREGGYTLVGEGRGE